MGFVCVQGLAACGEKADSTPAPAPTGLTESEPSPVEAATATSPRCAAYDSLRRPYFGDTHVHTTLSLDAAAQGTMLTPDDAYRFAKGERVGIQPYDTSGRAIRTLGLKRPLDFAVVADHAEFLGELAICRDPEHPSYEARECELYREDKQQAYFQLNALLGSEPDQAEHAAMCGEDASICLEAVRGVWQDIQRSAASHLDTSDACAFTTFVGYEWSGSPGTQNLHRNVIFANATVPELPTSYFEAPRVEQLWEALTRDCLDAEGDCDVLTIPHNANLSNGLMYEGVDANGKPIGGDYARTRASMEPLAEVFQHKGDGECHPDFNPGDEACGFEKMPFNSLGSSAIGLEIPPSRMDFLRNALLEGLALEQKLGVNPYRFGMIASTDTHLGTPGAVDEALHPGHGGAGPSARTAMPAGLNDSIAFNPGGLAVLWAEENTRESLFAAMRRREAYGTSGPRIVLRFFAGWDYPEDLCGRDDLAEQGYAAGVPMGGELRSRDASGAGLSFVVAAQQDSGVSGSPGTPLQRLQIVKGWVDASGEVHERVYDVAKAERAVSVDTQTCQPDGKGAASLCAVWKDPDFDATQSAFYYARALQDPTCRWSAWQCLDAKVDCAVGAPEGYEGCCDERYPASIQERAWSSPVWVMP